MLKAEGPDHPRTVDLMKRMMGQFGYSYSDTP